MDQNIHGPAKRVACEQTADAPWLTDGAVKNGKARRQKPLAVIGPDLSFLAITIGLENVSGGMGTAVFVAYLSSLCNVAYTATQYALLSSLMAVARTVLVSPAGWLVEQVGWMEFFILTTVAALPGLLLLWYLSGRQPIEQTSGTS